ncbi:uncharacterized protein K460DRAFT_416321 [Cucurbitaria berberidis CBS 394.84]|uniref:Uncharacterized protein n=1 Tax=Cucurbitaria berberidis CBS 394.84 TaxID=1168544 RepID=A0A9P4GG33_9PLEO|nr:uncharacterized protein K460DRAFT_416321 [Cucurbitaria berberidis CBS 394.84]KAF1844982.1 hypothetical protein K460DRAFT_416321 [Cucurbitaria berberidis CBS 394.84]
MPMIRQSQQPLSAREFNATYSDQVVAIVEGMEMQDPKVSESTPDAKIGGLTSHPNFNRNTVNARSKGVETSKGPRNGAENVEEETAGGIYEHENNQSDDVKMNDTSLPKFRNEMTMDNTKTHQDSGVGRGYEGVADGHVHEMRDAKVDSLTQGSGEKTVNGQTHPAAAAAAAAATSPSTPTLFQSKPSQAAQSYLAWLYQRQTRSPTAQPVYPECIAIGKRLGRPPHKVYDEVLYHWGLETDSRHGEWHRQNRLKVLGEDPRFDEERMGFWNAWMKRGRETWNIPIRGRG